MKRMLFAILIFCFRLNLHAQQWEVTLPDSITISHGLIDSDNTVWYAGSSYNAGALANGAIIKLYDNGQYELRTYTDHGEKHLFFGDIVSLSNGNLFVVGRTCIGDIYNSGELVVLILDNKLDVISEQTFQVAENFDGFSSNCAIIDDDGTVAVFAIACRPSPNIPGSRQFIGTMFRFTQEGECLNYRYLMASPPDPICYLYQITDFQFLNDPWSNHTILLCPGTGGMESFIQFDYDFNLLEEHQIEDPLPQWVFAQSVRYAQSDYWYNEDEMLIVCEQRDTIQENQNHPHVLIGHINREGQITERIEINKQDTLMYPCQYRSGIAYANDSTIYVLAKCNPDNWAGPFYAQIYLANKELEILGCISFGDDLNYWPVMVFATSDMGCIINTLPDSFEYGATPLTIRRLSREDFQPTWSIGEYQKNDAGTIPYPNPATNEVNFNLIDVPTDGSVRMRITNTSGQVFIDRIIRGSGSVLTMGVATLPSGIYSYSIYDKGTFYCSGKFVKN